MFTLPDDKVANGAITYVDAKGNPAKVDGVPAWSSSDDAVIAVAQAADGMSAVITPMGLGTAQVRIEADADLGSGVVSLVTLGDVEVIAGTAVAGVLTLALPDDTGGGAP